MRTDYSESDSSDGTSTQSPPTSLSMSLASSFDALSLDSRSSSNPDSTDSSDSSDTSSHDQYDGPSYSDSDEEIILIPYPPRFRLSHRLSAERSTLSAPGAIENNHEAPPVQPERVIKAHEGIPRVAASTQDKSSNARRSPNSTLYLDSASTRASESETSEVDDDITVSGDSDAFPDDVTECSGAYSNNSYHSAMSSSEASSLIDSFFSDTDSFTRDQTNKLRLWQGLCIEFGIVDVGDVGSHDLPNLPDLPGGESPSSSRASTPRPYAVHLPTSLTKVRLLLKSKAHVNLHDYLQARQDPTRRDQHDGSGNFADLLHGSALALRRYTLAHKKTVSLTKVKAEWLQPLLKDFGFKHSRA